ncbi:MAG: DUF2442 domain-containing protein [Anaerolinea sp.]|nr:DUF2442 domain-containing protein [Anaerolinea sp.]
MNPDAVPREEDRPVAVDFDGGMLRVQLQDGRLIATPLAWYPSLLNASPEQRQAYALSAAGIHWDELDEDLSVEGMLYGIRPRPQSVKA